MIIISKWSGKADFADSIEIHGGIDFLKNSKVYIYEEQPDGTYKDKLLNFEKESDVVPYYAHIIGCAYHNNEENKHTIHLSSKSYPDSHEEEMLGYHLKTLIRYYNYCKRKKIEFNVSDALKKFSEWTLRYDGDTIKELVLRVKEKGKKASIEGLKLEFSERYRELLREELDRVLDKEEKEREVEEILDMFNNISDYDSEKIYPQPEEEYVSTMSTLIVHIKNDKVEDFIKRNDLEKIVGEYYNFD